MCRHLQLPHHHPQHIHMHISICVASRVAGRVQALPVLGRRYKKLPHYHLMQQVHLDGIPEAEAGWGPAPGQPAFSAGQLAKARTLNPMFWR